MRTKKTSGKMHKCLNVSISTDLHRYYCKIKSKTHFIFYVFPSSSLLPGIIFLPLPHDRDFIIILTLITHDLQSSVQFFKGQSVRDLLFGA